MSVKGSGGTVSKYEEVIAKQDEEIVKRANLKSERKNVLNPFHVIEGDSEKDNQKAFIQWCAMASLKGVEYANLPAAYERGFIVGYAVTPSIVEMKFFPEVTEKEKLLEFIYSNNLNQSNGIAGSIAKSMGAKAGMPDLGLDVKNASLRYSGLRIEMKRETQRNAKNGGLTEEQVKWRKHLVSQGFFYMICYSWKEARDVVCDYLGLV